LRHSEEALNRPSEQPEEADTEARSGGISIIPQNALKLYTLYAPANHRDGVVPHTRDEAEADNEHFDGKTTE
jgi:hypothetical protein